MSDIFNQPIKNIEQAKKYFHAMGCSHFHMMREYPWRYEEYKKLNISKEQEIIWRTEKVDEYYSHIIEERKDIELWVAHSHMADLVNVLKTDAALDKMLKVSQYIHDKVPRKDRVIVAETIIGRTFLPYRNGLIYLAYDLKNILIAQEFVNLALHFGRIDQESRDIARCHKAIKRCNEIKQELGL